jgi:hypothetical protein
MKFDTHQRPEFSAHFLRRGASPMSARSTHSGDDEYRHVILAAPLAAVQELFFKQ